jgi:hypothetical protein
MSMIHMSQCLCQFVPREAPPTCVAAPQVLLGIGFLGAGWRSEAIAE